MHLLKYLFMVTFALTLFSSSADARHRRVRDGYYSDNDGYRHFVRRDRVRAHRRRRNVLLGVGGLGLITGSGTLTGVGLGGAAANEIIDRRNRDW